MRPKIKWLIYHGACVLMSVITVFSWSGRALNADRGLIWAALLMSVLNLAKYGWIVGVLGVLSEIFGEKLGLKDRELSYFRVITGVFLGACVLGIGGIWL